MHFLSGYAWHIVWVWVSLSMSTTPELSWLSLHLLMLVGLLFELAENNLIGRNLIWSWAGYTESTYSGDSAINAIADMLFVLLGWTAVQLTVLLDHSTTALAVLLSVGLVLLLVFAYLFRIEFRILTAGPPQKVMISSRSVPPLFVGR